MKTTPLLALGAVLLGNQLAGAQGTGFTYQGRLNSGTSPANGSYDLTFALFSVNSGPGQVGTTQTNLATGVSNGLFTVALDFGANFPGDDRWLEITARTNGPGAFTTLSPRQKITPTPYAIYAANAGNAAQVGGQGAAAFVAKAGDTMTGTLNLPPNGLAVGTSQLVVSGGRVGIGVSSPWTTLHVSSGGGDSTPQEWLNQQNTGDYSRLRFTVGDSYADRWDIGATPNGFEIYSGYFGRDFLNLSATGVSVGTNNFLVPGGNVGIGTAAPVARLHVHGDYNNTGVGGFLLDASDSGNPDQYALRINPFVVSGSFNAVGYQFQTKSAFGGINVPLTFDHAGNVGIGTTTPGDLLSLSGGALSFQNPATPWNPAPYVGMDYDSGSDALRLRANLASGALNTTLMTIKRDGGNVGIGSTAPQAKLEIQGGADQFGGSDPHAIALAYQGGGFRHWISSRHNGALVNNGLDFYLNTNTASAGSSAPGVGNVKVMTLDSVNGVKAIGGLVIETRTVTDPPNPAPGQIWLRTDLP